MLLNGFGSIVLSMPAADLAVDYDALWPFGEENFGFHNVRRSPESGRFLW